MPPERSCETRGCAKSAKLQCPTCLKLGIENSFFCSQLLKDRVKLGRARCISAALRILCLSSRTAKECFKASWTEHKKVHSKKEQVVETYNPWPNYQYTGSVRPVYPLTPKREVPAHIPRPDYADHPEGYPAGEREAKLSHVTKQLSPEEIEGMRVAGKLGREVLDIAAAAIQVGVLADEIDRIVHEATIERDCYPSPLNYYQFPKSCCTSVNEVICHGIPDKRPLMDGDIVNVDVTVYHRGFHGDLNETFFVGNVDEAGKKLVRVTHECLQQAIATVKPGARYRDVGSVIQKHAQSNGLSVVRTYCGHGIHQLFHTAPNVPHYAKNKAIGVMKPGHTFTIEPMICEGTWRDEMWPDEWTAVTQDGRRSAQFEETLLVTETGVEVLTRRLDKGGQPYFMD